MRKKSNRVVEAIETAPTLSTNITYSIGDSLTYIIRKGYLSDNNNLLASRRYQTVIYLESGNIDISYANINELKAINEYSDLTDRQSYTGQTKQVTIETGNLVVLDSEEAYRILPTQELNGIILRVTVEGRSFHNK